MARKTIASSRRKSGCAVFTALAVIALIAVAVFVIPHYPYHAYLSGWVLFALMLILTFFNLRKKVPFLRMGSVSFWLKLHIYLGLFSGPLFFVHMGWHWPSGIFGQLFAWCFLIVFVSGLVGWWISREFPRMLTVAGYETPFDRIPHARANIRKQAEALVLETKEGETPSLAAVRYADELGLFFTKPCNFWAHIRQSRSPQAAHKSQFEELERYTKPSDREMLDKLRELVAQKHMLDYQYSLQLALRLWLFVHIPLSYSLLIFSLLHIILVYAFSGAVS